MLGSCSASRPPLSSGQRDHRAIALLQRPLPDPALTPGATLEVTEADVCTPGYTEKVRDVPESVRHRVLDAYRAEYVPHAYELDHLISLELGGSNSQKNLWPEPYGILWNAHVKDALENRLHREVCGGRTSLAAAQKEISSNWIAAYQTHFHSSVPLTAHRRAQREERERSGY